MQWTNFLDADQNTVYGKKRIIYPEQGQYVQSIVYGNFALEQSSLASK